MNDKLNFDNMPKISLKQFKEAVVDIGIGKQRVRDMLQESSIYINKEEERRMINAHIYHTYHAYSIQNIRLDITGNYPTIGGTSKYIEILEALSNKTQLFAKQLIIIACGGIDDTFKTIVDIYREIDDAIVIMEPMALCSISEDEVYNIGDDYGFTKVMECGIFNRAHTFMILDTAIGKELIKMLQNQT